MGRMLGDPRQDRPGGMAREAQGEGDRTRKAEQPHPKQGTLPARDDETHLAAGSRHHQETGDINDRPCHQRDPQPEAIADRPSRRLRQAPDGILDRNGQREIRCGERQITGHRRQKQADTLPQPHADTQQHGSADQDQPGRSLRDIRCHL
jgi:hypothetical protein